ncbi:hypothetical protein QJS04_geneDACA014275 [Acorus gramineus]|uniref:Agenet domain-containing protein n=1 Tax=Acorus gramineus TaxID=55184 RepID=A0AAV9BVZ9_ACOGR|nr:hypothetical protein QJS04_geneDACA014275 [Acorus gramineus]
MGPKGGFSRGQEVEVAGDEEGLRGAWYEATVVRSVPSKGKLTLAYRTLALDNDPSKPLKETVDAGRVRPAPPGPAGPAAAFRVGQVVDAFYNEGWWVGTVSEVRVTDHKGGPVRTPRYKVRFPDPADEREFGVEELRAHLEWVDGKWVPAADCAVSGGKDVNGTKKCQNNTAKEVDVPLISLLTDIEDETIMKSLSDAPNSKSKRVKASGTHAKVEHMRPSKKTKKFYSIEDNSRLVDWLKVSRAVAAPSILEERGNSSIAPPLPRPSEKIHVKKKRRSRRYSAAEIPSNVLLEESDNESPLQKLTTMICALPALQRSKDSPEIMKQNREEKERKKRSRKSLKSVECTDARIEGSMRYVEVKTSNTGVLAVVYPETQVFQNKDEGSSLKFCSLASKEDNSNRGEGLNIQSANDQLIVDKGNPPMDALQRLQCLTGQAFDNVTSCPSNFQSCGNPNVDVQSENDRNREKHNGPLQHSIVQVAMELTSMDASIVAVPSEESPAIEKTAPLDSCPLVVLPFEKSSPVWKVIDSMEIFHKRPQHPHFQPLEKIPELYREGSAISQMVTFSTLVDGIYKLQFEDSKEKIEDQLKVLTDLERHGFDIQPERACLEALLEVKNKCGGFDDRINKLEQQILDENQKNDSLDEELAAVDDQFVVLLQKKASLLNQQEMNNCNIDKLIEEIETMKGAMSRVKCEFQNIVGEISSKKAV